MVQTDVETEPEQQEVVPVALAQEEQAFIGSQAIVFPRATQGTVTLKDGTCFCHAGKAQLCQTQLAELQRLCEALVCAPITLHVSSPVCQACSWICLSRESPPNSPKPNAVHPCCSMLGPVSPSGTAGAFGDLCPPLDGHNTREWCSGLDPSL